MYANAEPLRQDVSSTEYDFEDENDEFDYGSDEAASSNYTVELTVSCRNLASRLFSKPNPMVVLYKRGKKDWIECGRTEQISNTPDPDYAEKFTVDYNFHEVQFLLFKVYNNTAKEQKLAENNLIGKVACTLGEIVKAQPRFRTELRVEGKTQSKGQVIVIPEQLQTCRNKVIMQWRAKNLDRKDFAGKSDPFMVFYKRNADGSFSKCYQTEVVKHTFDPSFKRIEIPVSKLCNGDYDRRIKVEIYDWNRSGKSDSIGMFTTNLRRLSRGPGMENTYRCVNPAKLARKKSYKSSGVVHLISFTIEVQHTFVDFIRSGFCKLKAHDKKEAVGNVIKYYDTDSQYPAFGFGAELPQGGRVSDLFPLNDKDQSPACNGIAGIVDAYMQTIKRVKLSEPTNFAPVIKLVTSLASRVKNASDYYVLLIITDGQIGDLSRTKEAIFYAAKLPISIIVVGVGNGDFSDMNELDGDSMPLQHNGVPVDRDIVQFVPMREFIDPGEDRPCDHEKLAKEVLEEVPGQLVEYMKSKGLKPM